MQGPLVATPNASVGDAVPRVRCSRGAQQDSTSVVSAPKSSLVDAPVRRPCCRACRLRPARARRPCAAAELAQLVSPPPPAPRPTAPCCQAGLRRCNPRGPRWQLRVRGSSSAASCQRACTAAAAAPQCLPRGAVCAELQLAQWKCQCATMRLLQAPGADGHPHTAAAGHPRT